MHVWLIILLKPDRFQNIHIITTHLVNKSKTAWSVHYSSCLPYPPSWVWVKEEIKWVQVNFIFDSITFLGVHFKRLRFYSPFYSSKPFPSFESLSSHCQFGLPHLPFFCLQRLKTENAVEKNMSSSRYRVISIVYCWKTNIAFAVSD